MRRINGARKLLWDCDGNIWRHVKNEDKIVTKEFGIELTEEFTKQYFEMFERFEIHFEYQKLTTAEYINLIAKCMPILSKNNISAEEFYHKWIQIETSVMNEGALETIQYFHHKGYTNIIFSDMPYDKQIILLEKYNLLQYIDDICTGDNNYLKRNPKSKDRIIDKGHEKEYVIIGDSLKNDIAFANHAGIRSIWFNPTCKKNKSKYKPTMQVTSLYEVCQRIKQ